jgi:AAA+ ATPase superfamily predicted ATPase
MNQYRWPPRGQFINRLDDLGQLESWWDHATRDALALIGRRRVGKSWLFRRFAHGKLAVILVADRRLLTTQMARFANALEPELGVRPEIASVAELIRILYVLGGKRKVLAVIDEFPFLLPEGRAREEVLTEVQAVMEEHRDASQTKLVLCGSLVSQMEALLPAEGPLHGRLRRLDVWPLTFAESKGMTSASDSPEERITRFALAGGMARYLAELGHGPLRDAVCENVLDRRSQLFDDPRAVLEQELRSPATYFSILEALADRPATTEHLTGRLQMRSSQLTFYLDTLREMRLLSSSRPVGAPDGSRSYKHRVSDGFIRFWFRFVFGNQEGLQEGLSPRDVWDGDIEPYLADFVAPTFEELCVRYARRVYGARAQKVGGWWGPALNKHRQARTRLTEEIDVVGAHRRNLVLVGECKWTTDAMPKRVLDDLRDYKLPALEQERRLKVPTRGPQVLLFSRTGFSDELIETARSDDTVSLVTLDELVSELDHEVTQPPR